MAVSEIEKNRRRWEENPKGLAFAAYADALRKAGEAEQALEVLQAGLEYHPDYIPANIVRGRCHLDLGEDAAAEAAFARVLALDPENVIALKALADVTERGERWDEATRWLHALLAIDRGNEAAREQMARIEIARHEAETAAAQAAAEAESRAALDAQAEAEAAAEAERVEAERAAAAAAEAARAAADPEPIRLEQSQPDAWVPDAAVTQAEEPAVSELIAPVAGLESTTFSADVPTAVVEGFETEETAESTLLLSASAAAGEFAVEDAADGFRSALPDARVLPADATAGTPSWADVGKGEYVPALFADADQPAEVATPVAVSPLDGLELERSTDEPLVSAVVETAATPEEPPMGSVAEAPDAPAPAWASFDLPVQSQARDTAEEPAADAVAHALLGAAPAIEPVESAVVESAADAVTGVVLADVAGESLVLPDLEAGADEAVPPAEAETVPEAEAVPAAPVPVMVPGIVQSLALAPHEVEAADRAARELVEAELAAAHERPLRDVLAEAPGPDPAVVALLAAPAVVTAEDEPTTAVRLLTDETVLVEDLVAGEPAMRTDVAADEPVLVDAVAVTDAPMAVEDAPEAVAEAPVEPAVASAASVLEAAPAAPLATFVADEPDDESAAVPPGFSTPLLVTAAMATLYAQQGHLHEALATYRSLEAREPGRHAAAIADLEVRIAAALPARPVFAARVSGGQPVRDFFQSLVRTVPPALAGAVAPAAGTGAALRKADDPVSLGRLFGEESTVTAVPLGVAARAPSFDEFYGGAGAAAEQGGRDDIEQFHAWLQGLKS